MGDFLENNAIPQYATIVKGGELAYGTRKRIEGYSCAHIKGNGRQTLIPGVDIETKPLAV